MIYKPRSLSIETQSGGGDGNPVIQYPVNFDLSGPVTGSAWIMTGADVQAWMFELRTTTSWAIAIAQWQWSGYGQAFGVYRRFSTTYKYRFYGNILDTQNVWTHLVWFDDGGLDAVDDTKGYLYQDGVKDTGTQPGTQNGVGDPPDTGTELNLHYDDGGNWRFAHLALWNRRLEERELLQLPYRSPLFIPQNLLFYDYVSPPELRNRAPGQLGAKATINESYVTYQQDFPQVEQPDDTTSLWSGWFVGELDVVVYPTAVSASADSLISEAELGDISLTPSVASSASSIVNPSVNLGDASSTPAPATVVTSKSGPQVVQNSLAISPSAVFANTAKVDPDVGQSTIQVDPESAIAAAVSVDPEIGFTGIDVSPDPAVAVCVGVDPAVDDAQDVITVPSTAGTDTVDPSLFWSSQSATPTPASAGTLAFIDLEYTPAPVTAGTSIVDPTVYIGDALIYFYPDPAVAATDTVDPTLYFTDCPLYPPPATAGTDSVDPTYYVYGGGYPVVRTSPAITIPVGIPPTTQQGSIALSPDLVESATESVDPTLFWTSTSAYPDEAVAAASVVAPIAGVFFRYFMKADISLGEWTNELGSTIDIHESIDEDPADDDDFIQSDWGPDQETYKGKLDKASEPDDDLYHYVEYRYKKENPRERMDMVVRLRQGDNVISGWSHDDIGIDFVTQRQVLSEAEAYLITNYQDLYLEFEAWERN